jgi:catechol 2,3-dioxygenase-like lactoylglutathione lyase family enzyme
MGAGLGSGIGRRSAVLGGLGLGAAVLAGGIAKAADAPAAAGPALLRIRMVTIGAAHPKEVAAVYEKWFGYKIRHSSRITPVIAASWGLPDNAGQMAYALSSDSYPDILLRIVGIDAQPGYVPGKTAGWNGFVFMVDDIMGIHRALQASPFKVERAPYVPAKDFPTLMSMDVTGPAGETIFLECETGDRTRGFLPDPRGPVGRPHLAWVSGPDILKVRDWYVDSFGITKRPVQDVPVPDGAAGATMPNTLLMMKAKANFIELEGNPAQFAPRPRHAGQLPPGNAMPTFGVATFDGLSLSYITPPQPLYGKARAATVRDPNGNLVELIEDLSAQAC